MLADWCIFSIIRCAMQSLSRWFLVIDFQSKACLGQQKLSWSIRGRSARKDCRPLGLSHQCESWEETLQCVLDHSLLSAWQLVHRFYFSSLILSSQFPLIVLIIIYKLYYSPSDPLAMQPVNITGIFFITPPPPHTHLLNKGGYWNRFVCLSTCPSVVLSVCLLSISWTAQPFFNIFFYQTWYGCVLS